jgi:hypothetical protein
MLSPNAFRTSLRRRSGSHSRTTETLENRVMLAAIVVDTAADVVDAGDGLTSLREATAAANSTTVHDDISFAPSLAGSTITLSQGALTISEDLTIAGLGADRLTISGGGASKIFDVTNAAASIDVDINDLSLTGGNGSGGVADGAGGAIYNNEVLTLRGVHLFGNSAVNGGAIHSDHITRLFSSAVTGNAASSNGGGIYGTDGGTEAAVSFVEINNSTLDGNLADHDGGGLYLAAGAGSVDLEVFHSTITGNTADANGADEGGTGPGSGGGIALDDAFPVPFAQMLSSIVAGNDADGTPSDIAGTFDADFGAFYSLIGDADSSGGIMDGVNNNIVGNGGVGVLPLAMIVGPLQNNGGPTPTRALVAGSPAIDAGPDSNLIIGEDNLPFPFDQRGPGFVRLIDGDGDGEARIDIGAFEATKPPSPIAGGRDIIGRASSGTIVVMESTGSSFTGHVWGGQIFAGIGLYYGDFNGDGLTDAAYLTGGGGSVNGARVNVMINNGAGFDNPRWVGSVAGTKAYVAAFAGDYNGDGRDDHYFLADDGTWEIAVTSSSGSASTSRIPGGGWNPAFTYSDVQLGDFNSDGRADVIGRNSAGYWVVGLSNGSGTAPGLTFSSFGAVSTFVDWHDAQTGDFNGDGRSDIMARASSGTWVVGLSNGTSFDFSVWGGWSTIVDWDGVQIGDFNGDGMADVVGHSSSGRIVIGLSDGAKFNFSIWANVSTIVTWPQIVVGDYNSDGQSDLALRASSGTWVVGLSDGAQLNLSVWGGWSTIVDWDDVDSGTFAMV